MEQKNNLKEIPEALEELEESQEKSQEKSQKDNATIIQILKDNEKQGQKRIRILPTPDGSSPFKEVWFH